MRQPTVVVGIRVGIPAFQKLCRLAKSKKLPPATFARQVIEERVAAETK
jgi:hypothetical protein